jgi:hypothetical protein
MDFSFDKLFRIDDCSLIILDEFLDGSLLILDIVD